MLNITVAGAIFGSVPRLLLDRKASRASIAAFQDRRLREIVRHAYDHVPYYRRLFDAAGVGPADIRGRADLHLIPVTTKATLRTLSMEEIVADNVDRFRLHKLETNGSTGVPLTVYRTRGEGLTAGALIWRVREEADMGRGLRIAILNWGDPNKETGHSRKERISLRQRIAGIESMTRINCVASMDEVVDRLKRARPDVISGYAGVLSRVAEALGPDQRDVTPRLVISVSEVLTPAMRARIEHVFRAPVRDVYASWELALMAHQCRKGGPYHVADDNLIMEVMRDGRDVGEGESGDVVATSLQFAAMPFIRYELGDVVTRGPESCPCGSPFTTLSAIQGRMVDYFRFPDGRVMHPYEISRIIWETAFRCISQYQMIQETPRKIVASVVLRSDADRPEVVAIFEKVRPLLGRDVDLVVEYLDNIPLGIKGKFGVYRSLVSSEYNATA